MWIIEIEGARRIVDTLSVYLLRRANSQWRGKLFAPKLKGKLAAAAPVKYRRFVPVFARSPATDTSVLLVSWSFDRDHIGEGEVDGQHHQAVGSCARLLMNVPAGQIQSRVKIRPVFRNDCYTVVLAIAAACRSAVVSQTRSGGAICMTKSIVRLSSDEHKS